MNIQTTFTLTAIIFLINLINCFPASPEYYTGDNFQIREKRARSLMGFINSFRSTPEPPSIGQSQVAGPNHSPPATPKRARSFSEKTLSTVSSTLSAMGLKRKLFSLGNLTANQVASNGQHSFRFPGNTRPQGEYQFRRPTSPLYVIKNQMPFVRGVVPFKPRMSTEETEILPPPSTNVSPFSSSGASREVVIGTRSRTSFIAPSGSSRRGPPKAGAAQKLDYSIIEFLSEFDYGDPPSPSHWLAHALPKSPRNSVYFMTDDEGSVRAHTGGSGETVDNTWDPPPDVTRHRSFKPPHFERNRHLWDDHKYVIPQPPASPSVTSRSQSEYSEFAPPLSPSQRKQKRPLPPRKFTFLSTPTSSKRDDRHEEPERYHWHKEPERDDWHEHSPELTPQLSNELPDPHNRMSPNGEANLEFLGSHGDPDHLT